MDYIKINYKNKKYKKTFFYIKLFFGFILHESLILLNRQNYCSYT